MKISMLLCTYVLFEFFHNSFLFWILEWEQWIVWKQKWFHSIIKGCKILNLAFDEFLEFLITYTHRLRTIVHGSDIEINGLNFLK